MNEINQKCDKLDSDSFSETNSITTVGDDFSETNSITTIGDDFSTTISNETSISEHHNNKFHHELIARELIVDHAILNSVDINRLNIKCDSVVLTKGNYVIYPENNISIIYGNAKDSDINIYLGSKSRYQFSDNYRLVIKNISGLYPTIKYGNINIISDSKNYIEHCDEFNTIRICKSTYIDSLSGSIILRYFNNPERPIWMIESIFRSS